jgi:hypothetical protein
MKIVCYGNDMSVTETECFVLGFEDTSRKKGDDGVDDEEKKA